jgi:hypothetical protein
MRVIKLADAQTAILNSMDPQAAIRGLQSAGVKFTAAMKTEFIPRSGLRRYRGIYAASWKSMKLVDGVMIYSDAPHAPLIEYRVRPGMKIGRRLIEALLEWVTKLKVANTRYRTKKGKVRVHRATETERRRLAWAIAMSMQKRGMWQPIGLRIFTRALTRLPKYVHEEIRREMLRK